MHFSNKGRQNQVQISDRQKTQQMKIYQAFQRTFNKNNATLLTLVHELLIAQNIKTQNIEHRTKTVTSFLEKIDRDGNCLLYTSDAADE